MMEKIQNQFEIHFYDQTKVAIFYESVNCGELEENGQIYLFCAYAIRNLVNCKTDTRLSLAHSLMKLDPDNINEFIDINLVNLIGKGKKIFIGKSEYNSEKKNFQLSTKGFGVLGRGIEYYSPVSVLALIKYFIEKNHQNKEYIDKLLYVAYKCGEAGTYQDLNIYNQQKYIAFIFKLIFDANEQGT